jgi:hypothetical protein
MQMKKISHTHWGRPLALLECLAFVLFLALAFSETLVAHALTVAVALAFVTGSGVLFWRMLRRRPGDPPVALGQTAAMPHRWRRWVLGESDRKSG